MVDHTMVQTPAPTLTLEAFLELPETKPPSEYIDGQIVQKPMPQGKHSAIQGELVSAINRVVRKPQIARAFPELRCTYPAGSHPSDVYGGKSTVPDIAVFVWQRIPRDENGEIANTFPLAPDWTIEILSPDQNQTRVTKNILHCLKHGTQMGWLIDPDEQTVFVFQPSQEPEVFDDAEAGLLLPEFTGEFSLTVGELFSWLA